jgi:polyisoprenoid-binding protein YceI
MGDQMGFSKKALAACAAVLMTSSIAGAQENSAVIRLRTAPHGNEARYRVREQLAGVDFPNDAIGKTSRVDGSIAVAADGTVLVSDSRFTIDLASLTSDRDRRDNYLRRNTLQTEQHPTAVFVPKVIRGIKFPMPQNGEVKFQMVGDLTIKGVTKEVTWDVVARSETGSVIGQAKTRFTFADLQLEKPRVRSVLTVDDDITLEYDFQLVPVR